MKKITALISILVLSALASTLLAAGVADTKHNLASWGPGPVKATSESEVCKFCHTPHAANPAVPLWNHKADTTSFQKYSSATLAADDAAIVGTTKYDQPLAGTSKLCMGCHDGLTALGALVANDESVVMNYNTLQDYGSSYYGSDLRNKHPVSFVYDGYGAGTLIYYIDDLGVPKSNTYGLPSDTNPNDNTIINNFVKAKWEAEGKRVECTICHDPHVNRATDNQAQLPFWVSSSIGSYDSHDSVCVACHSQAYGEYTGFDEYSSLW